MYELSVRAAALHFRARGGSTVYVVCDDAHWSLRDYNRYKGEWYREGSRYKHADGVEMGEATRYFLVYLVDCFDPPVAVVCARNESDALDAFADELTWSHVNEVDLPDYDDEGLHFNSKGVPCDLEEAFVEELRLVHVELEGV